MKLTLTARVLRSQDNARDSLGTFVCPLQICIMTASQFGASDGAQRTVIVAATHPWHAPYRLGLHHLATQFARHGWRTLYLTAPWSPMHIAANRRDGRLRACSADGWQGPDGLTVLSPFSPVVHSRHPPLNAAWTLRNWHRFCWPNLKRFMAERGFLGADVMLVGNPAMAPMIDVVSPRRIVLRIADHLRGLVAVTPAMMEATRSIAARADLIVYTARLLEPDVRTLRARAPAVHIPNGVDWRHFQTPAAEPPDLAGLGRPRLVYVGATGPWFDAELVREAARRLLSHDFVIIGPVPKALERSGKRPSNLHLLGPRPYATIPAYLQHADIGIIPFDTAGHPDLVHRVNPLKMFEYLAAGLPVVASATREIETLDIPCHTYRRTSSLEESLAGFARAIDEALKPAAAPDALAARKKAARSADWAVRYAALIEALSDCRPGCQDAARLSMRIG